MVSSEVVGAGDGSGVVVDHDLITGTECLSAMGAPVTVHVVNHFRTQLVDYIQRRDALLTSPTPVLAV